MISIRFAFPILAVSLLIGVLTVFNRPVLEWKFLPQTHADTRLDDPKFDTVLDYSSTAGTAHAPAIRVFEDAFSVIWFDGTRESHDDVVILESQFRNVDGSWISQPNRELLNRFDLGDVSSPRQAILTLGNTIENPAFAGALFATIVSAGGWAAASIADVRFGDGVLVSLRKLNLSPFLNRSYLVKSPTVAFSNGDLGLPAYFELGNSFGELVRLDHSGRVRDTRRISQGRFGIQPVIVVLDEDNALALLRNFDDESDRLVSSRTTDGGQSWSDARLMDLPNPNSPVGALRLSSGQILLVFNDSPNDTTILKLAVSDNGGGSWRRIHTLEEGGGAARYPMMRFLPNGEIVLVYSHNSKKGIKAHVFNEAWVLSQ